MKNKLLIIICMIIVVLPMITAISLGIFEQDKKVELLQVCDNCTSVNLTTIQYPNSTIGNFNTNMTKFVTTYNYSFTGTNSLGDYIYTTCGDPDGTLTCESVDFKITPNGDELSIPRAIVYILVLVVSFFIFWLLLMGSIKIPWKDIRNDEGKLVSVNDLKWLKLFCMVLLYLDTMFITLMINEITESFLFLDTVSSFFNGIYNVLFAFMFPLLIILPWFIIYLVVANKKTKKFIERGLPNR